MVSIIVPIDDWNNNGRRKLFKKTVFSILSQSVETEIICIFSREIDKDVDEQAWQHFSEICGDLKRYVCTEKSKQLNFGIEKSIHNIIGYVNPGTYLYPEKLLLQVSPLKANTPTWSFSGFATLETDRVNYFMGEQYFGQFCNVRNNASMADAIVNRFPDSCFINGDSTLFTKKMIETVGLFDENLSEIQNYDMWLRMAYVQQPYVIMQPLLLQEIQQSENVEDRKKEEFVIVQNKVRIYAIGGS